jgi:hypothetical protein
VPNLNNASEQLGSRHHVRDAFLRVQSMLEGSRDQFNFNLGELGLHGRLNDIVNPVTVM